MKRRGGIVKTKNIKFVKKLKAKGTSLLEAIISLALFGFLLAVVNVAFNNLLASSVQSQRNLSTVSIANEQMEIVRNLSYSDIGIVGNLEVPGVLTQTQTIIKDNVRYTVKIAVNAVDDPFDQQLSEGGDGDSVPFDYKQIRLEVNCEGCPAKSKAVLSSIISPKLQEQEGISGTLSVAVLDALGVPVSGAEVRLTYNSATPSTTIKTTAGNGRADFLGLTPAVNAYHIEVSKTEFSSAQTYPLMGNPFTPLSDLTDVTILADQVISKTFQIDRLATLTIHTKTSACSTAPDGTITLKVSNDDKIGTKPDTFQYSPTEFTMSTDGDLPLSNLKWGIYSISITGASPQHSITSAMPNLPVTLPPGANNEVTLVLGGYSQYNLLVNVKDGGTPDKLPVPNTNVRVFTSGMFIEGPPFNKTIQTGTGSFEQTGWGEEVWGEENDETGPTMWNIFFADNNMGYWAKHNIWTAALYHSEGTDFLITLALNSLSTAYESSGFLESSTFDAGTTIDFTTLKWNPQAQDPATGTDPVKFQIATTDVLADPPENTLWNFIGPNGTDQTYYTSYESSLIPSTEYQNKRYLRYKVFLSTADTTKTPTVDDVSIIYSSSCIGPGQAFFENVPEENYDIEVTHPEYDGLDGSPAALLADIPVSGQTIQDIKIAKPAPIEPPAGNILVYVGDSSANHDPIIQNEQKPTVKIFQGDPPNETIIASMQTDAQGDAFFQGLEPDTYDVSVSLPGYSTERTYAPGNPALNNGTPINPSPIVVDNGLAQVDLTIDQTGTLVIAHKTYTCQDTATSPAFTLQSKKLITTNSNPGDPIAYKYPSQNLSGNQTLSGIEWGEYDITFTDADYFVLGSIPEGTISVPAGASAGYTYVLDDAAGHNSLLVALKNSSTGAYISTSSGNAPQYYMDIQSASYHALALHEAPLSGKPFYDFTNNIMGISLLPDQTTSQKTVSFKNADRLRLDFMVKVYQVSAPPPYDRTKLIDVSANVNVNLSNSQYIRRTGLTSYNVTITNTSATALSKPLVLVFEDILVATPTVVSVNADGMVYDAGCVLEGKTYFRDISAENYNINTIYIGSGTSPYAIDPANAEGTVNISGPTFLEILLAPQ